MQIFNSLKDWQVQRSTLSASIGFVPTMGNLHAGHASLYAMSKKENALTVASIFINPKQFNRSDDYLNYPRTLEADLALLEKLGVDYCLLPTEEAIYPDAYSYQIQENALSQHMEGKHRPGHFTGVLTIVMKLLNLVSPQRAYFGEKDYQQYQLIREMAAAFFMNTEIKSCPTIREKSGLAFSSRNNRLSSSERELADIFAQIFQQKKAASLITQELSDKGIEVEYLEDFAGRRYCAVHIGSVRLIDNLALNEP